MTANVMFQYPGGKSHLASDIVSFMPHHECYVEGFGGSGALLLNKPKAEVNVYNDLDSDLVHFFTVFREAAHRLIKFLERVPYSSEVYEDFARAFYEDEFEDPPLTDNLASPSDVTDSHIKRAGVFFTLRYMQFGAKYHGKSGFGRSKVLNQAKTFARAKERLDEFVGFWDDVTIENVSYEKLIGSYDSEETLFYFDPPYIGTEEYYRESDFDHQKFCKDLEQIEGYWIVSYDKIPEELEKYNRVSQDSTNFIDSGVKGESKETEEIFVFNYDPDDVQCFTGKEQIQMGLGDMIASEESEQEDKGQGGIRVFDENNDDLEGWLDDSI